MPRNVVVACLDSVRADYFDRYADRVPELAGTSLEQCRAASSWSTPSHASMLTGRLPSDHGVHTHSPTFDVAAEETFLGSLSDHRSVGISANIFFSPRFGFDDPFDEFVSVSTGRRFPRGIDVNEFVTGSDKESVALYWDFLKTALADDHPLRSLANGVLAQVNVSSTDAPIPKLLDDGANVVVSEAVRRTPVDRPVVMLLNFGDAHVPLRHVRQYDRSLHSADNTWTSDGVDVWDLVRDGPDAHREYLETRRELYSAAIEYLDRKMIELYERVDAASPHETTLVVTADHGENLGFDADEGLLNHKSSLTEALLHVPLYVINPPSTAPDHVGAYTSHLELGDLVVALAEDGWTDVSRTRVPAEVVGMSPGPDPPEDERAYWDRMLRCAYEGTEKYVWDSLGASERYRIDHDRPCWQTREAEDVSVPSWARRLFETEIASYKRDAAAEDEAVTEDVDEGTRSRLEELGYL
jgi:hypothetical protein